MDKERYANAPLLFIHQAQHINPEVQMQYNYVSNRRSERRGKDKQEENIKKENTSNTKFKDLPVKEKINYIQSLPDNAPKMYYHVLTKERNYRGEVDEVLENELILSSSGNEWKLDIDKITDIQIIGF
ncbi:CotO family spore coat protein [Ornithinibacillus sp. 4-3]|uniref:CotO family spore coat protein n=1 Tax=Ornithinibacillus sp. 4-3 TaxID=3231488 RepID=A0AB39HUB3_9BACI